MTSATNTAGLEKPAHMSDELFEVWRKIAPGPDYAPYRIASAEARARSAMLILTPEPGDKPLTDREKTARQCIAALQGQPK